MCAINNLLLYFKPVNGLPPFMNLRNPVKAADFPEKEPRALTG
jgi:hypothetical protein